MQAEEQVDIEACLGHLQTPDRAQSPSASAFFSQPPLCHSPPM